MNKERNRRIFSKRPGALMAMVETIKGQGSPTSGAVGCRAALLATAAFATLGASAQTFYTADSSNTLIQTVGLNQGNLGNATLSNPSALAVGPNNFNYAAIQFTPTQTGSYFFGQIFSPVDTVMILYSGIYDPANPGAGALVGNDDTSQANHRVVLGNPSLLISCGGSSSWCPQVQQNVVVGQTYTLWVSVYSPSSNAAFNLPFDFYSTGAVVFGTYTGRSPIDLAQPFYLASELGVTVDPVFVGGTLKMDQVGANHPEHFTLSSIASNTIDQSGHDSVFSGEFSDAVAGTPGYITISDSVGGGSVVFSGINTYSGGTIIGNGGRLIVSQDANLGAATASLGFDGGTLSTTASFAMNRATTLKAGGGVIDVADGTTLTFSGAIDGSGALAKTNTGTLLLTGANSYTGPTTVSAGTLYINGNQSAATGPTSVANGATLGGNGTLGGNTTIADGGILAPGGLTTPGTLTINGNLGLSGGSILNYRFGEGNVPNGAFNDLTQVNGNLTLAGTLNVLASAGGSFDPGVYRVFNYTGTLSGPGLAIGTTPPPGSVSVQTAVAHEVNLIYSTGQLLSFWDGDAGPKNDGVINGGDGTWQSSGLENWTDSSGEYNAAWQPEAFAVFEAAPGTVTVNNSQGQVTASGMQFVANGYVITGEPITLVETTANFGQTIIRVGDGATDGTAYVATIDSVLQGSVQLVKKDLGTLVLNGINTYTGGTAILGGALQISQDANLGAAGTSLSLDDGTLATTASFTTNRNTTLEGPGGTFNVAAGTVFGMSGDISGSGSLTKTNTGTLLLTGTNNTWSGDTHINAGTLRAGVDRGRRRERRCALDQRHRPGCGFTFDGRLFAGWLLHPYRPEWLVRRCSAARYVL